MRKIEHEDDNNANTSDESVCISTDKEKNRDDQLQSHENLDDISKGLCLFGWRLNTRL